MLAARESPGASQFDASNGRVDFDTYRNSPVTTCILITAISARVAFDASSISKVEILLSPPIGAIGNEPMMLANLNGTDFVDPVTKVGNIFIPCQLYLPRNNNDDFWSIQFLSSGKTTTGIAQVSFILRDEPHTG
jgi:hypothetical protein